MSTRSLAIDASRSLSDARSGERGAYCFTGSLTGGGTRRFPLKPAATLVSGPCAWPEALITCSLFSGDADLAFAAGRAVAEAGGADILDPGKVTGRAGAPER
jgi:hypothetical protein